ARPAAARGLREDDPIRTSRRRGPRDRRRDRGRRGVAAAGREVDTREYRGVGDAPARDADRRRRVSALSRSSRTRVASEPARQRRGLGGELMRPILERADRDNLACYLETENQRNVPFYLKQGFEVIVDGEEARQSGV